MELIKCRKCGHEASGEVFGCPAVPRKKNGRIQSLIVVFLCLVGAGFLSACNNGNGAEKAQTTEVKDSVPVADKVVEEKVEQKDTTITAGLTLNTFTKRTKVDGKYVQSSLGNNQAAANLKKLGFVLVNKVKERRADYTGEEYFDFTLETYSKTIDDRVTTVKLEEDYSEINFPGLNDVEEFKKTVRAGGLKETKDGFEDCEAIYYDGTNVSIKGTKVTLHYKWEP